MNHIIVIGGGIGGLTAAALLAKEGYPVTVLEASNEWGGCAGKFQRGDFLFPVGATLGMGFEKGGIHERIFHSLKIPFPFSRPLEEVMRIHFKNGSLSYKRNRTDYLAELKKLFPHKKESITAFFEEVWKIGNEVIKLIDPLPVLPPKTAGEWSRLVLAANPGTVRLLPYLNKTLDTLIVKHGLQEEKLFVHLIDAQLIDSMQVTSKDCSAIIGAYALSIYHEGAFYIEGGLFQAAAALLEAAKQYGAVLKKRTWIKKLRQTPEGYTATDQKGQEWKAEQVIGNLPLQGFLNVLDEPLRKKCHPSYLKKAELPQWGTMTLYLAIDEHIVPEGIPLFMQVLQSETGEMAEGEHLFLSLSAPDDRIRAPIGCRTMTVSTHTALHNWETKEQYDAYKIKLTKKMMEGVKTIFPDIEKGLTHELQGAPKAWERFTRRPMGMVGGFPQTLQHSLFNSLSHRTGVKGLWLCGDSVFPGAGTIGVSVSGFHVFRSITGKGL